MTARCLIAVFIASGLWAMWMLAPRVPYADAWRFLANLIETPFPLNVLAADNGHQEVLPNLVRVLELHVFAADQSLQIAVGIVLVMATLLVYWRCTRQAPDALQRTAMLLVVVLGLFWLGNIRTLFHGNESVHAYSITLLLALGLRALVGFPGPAVDVTPGRACFAALCGIAATFCFGSGIATFGAFALVLALRRGSTGCWAILAIGLLVAGLLLSRGGGGAGLPALAPGEQLSMWLRWLAGPFVYAMWPVLDPAVAGQVPIAMGRVPLLALAQQYEAWFGPALLARWPHWLLGLAGLAWLWRLGSTAWRGGQSLMLLGIGTASFSLLVGAMIAGVRFEYFSQHPEQLLAPRYVVWSSLFWAGLLLATVAGMRRPRQGLGLVVLIAILLLPSQAWMGLLGANMRVVAETTAVAATVGVVDPELELGETVIEDLVRAVPAARTAEVAGFARSESQWFGRELPDGVARQTLERLDLVVVSNRLGGIAGRRVGFDMTMRDCEWALLVDDDDVVRGLARQAGIRGTRWIGWMRGEGGGLVSVACAPSRG